MTEEKATPEVFPNVKYDREAQALYLRLSRKPYAHTETIVLADQPFKKQREIIIDLDDEGGIRGLELLDVDL